MPLERCIPRPRRAPARARPPCALLLLFFLLAPPAPARGGGAAALLDAAAGHYAGGDGHGRQLGDDAFGDAMDGTFSLLSRSAGASRHAPSHAAIADLLTRQGRPLTAAALRNQSDAYLLRLAMLAAVAGVSRWQRDDDGRLQLGEDGALQPLYSPTAVESDILLCVVCTLLCVIVVFHVVSPPPAPAKPAPTPVLGRAQ